MELRKNLRFSLVVLFYSTVIFSMKPFKITWTCNKHLKTAKITENEDGIIQITPERTNIESNKKIKQVIYNQEDGSLAIVSKKGIKIYKRLGIQEEFSLVNIIKEQAIAFGPEGLVAVGSGNIIKIIYIPTNKILQTVKLKRQKVDRLLFSNTSLACMTEVGDVIMWEKNQNEQTFESRQIIKTKSSNISGITSFACYQDNILATGFYCGTIKIWKRKTPRDPFICVQTLKKHTKNIQALLFTSKGRLISAGREIIIWNIKRKGTFKRKQTLQYELSKYGVKDTVCSIISHKNILIAGSLFGIIKLWKKEAVSKKSHSLKKEFTHKKSTQNIDTSSMKESNEEDDFIKSVESIAVFKENNKQEKIKKDLQDRIDFIRENLSQNNDLFVGNTKENKDLTLSIPINQDQKIIIPKIFLFLK